MPLIGAIFLFYFVPVDRTLFHWINQTPYDTEAYANRDRVAPDSERPKCPKAAAFNSIN